MMLGMAVIVAVGQSIAVGFGVAGYLGIPYTQMSQMTFFILLGIGIDDMFIVVDCFDRTDQKLEMPLRLALAMEEAGPSVTLTSITDCLAFAVGSLIGIPAIGYFCLTSACAIASVFVIQTTFFAGCLVLDEQRMQSGRYDLVPCYGAGQASDLDSKQTDIIDENKEEQEQKERRHTASYITRFIHRMYAHPCSTYHVSLLTSTETILLIM